MQRPGSASSLARARPEEGFLSHYHPTWDDEGTVPRRTMRPKSAAALPRPSLRFQTTNRTYFQEPLKGFQFRPPAFIPQRNPPPYGWDEGESATGTMGMHRSTSQATFVRPPRIRQLEACKPRPSSAQPVWQTEPVGSGAPPLRTTYGTTFMSHGGFVIANSRPPACKPPQNKAPYSSVDDTGDQIVRSTSSAQFQKFPTSVILASRPPAFKPPVNRAPYSSVDDTRGVLIRSTSADSFVAPFRPRRREPFKPPRNAAPFSSVDAAHDDRTPSSTYKAEYKSVIQARRRQSMKPGVPANRQSTIAAAIFGDDAYA
jgi:hypothetical protein